MAHAHHHKGDVPSIGAGVVTVSDTRTVADDRSGQQISAALRAAGHRVAFYEIVRDEPTQITALLEAPPREVDVVITSGGTGLAPRDTTYEAVSALIEREMPGFGEIFRTLSYGEIGAAAMLSRATAGLTRQCFVFCLPGSTKAVELAMRELILPALPHLVGIFSEVER